ncbi:MAG: hypothetical protein N2738_03205 [Thermodesulfovibrionales bacterium]|nr:hypothetical protein [Thermodesulfovibrionales bacterium]
MPYVAGIRFKNAGKIYTFDTDGIEVKVGDRVIVESEFGLTIGKVVKAVHFIEQEERPLKKILRIATDEDFNAFEQNKILEKDAYDFCLERIKARGMVMKLVATEATLDRKRIIFYFTADGRVDFRELVKDLAARFKTRIEMRQIGVRDESKMIGGIGICGREFCCSTFLTSFDPVAIKMAKDQSLVLNIAKLSGVCGRLMCCLRFEFEGDPKEIIAEDEIPTLDEDSNISQDDATMSDILSKIEDEDTETINVDKTDEPFHEEIKKETDTSVTTTHDNEEKNSHIQKEKNYFEKRHHKKRRYFGR